MTEIKSYNNTMFDQAKKGDIIKDFTHFEELEFTTIALTRPTEFYKLQMVLLITKHMDYFQEAVTFADSKERLLELLVDIAVGLKAGIIDGNNTHVEIELNNTFKSDATATVILTPIAVLELAKSINDGMEFKSIEFVKGEVAK